MAPRTIAPRLKTQAPVGYIGGRRIHMAGKAKQALFASDLQHFVNTSMWNMTSRAPFHLYRGMLKNKRTPLFHMASNTRLPPGLPQGRTVGISMRVVTIGALHQSLGNLVVRGKGKLRHDVPVTTGAQRRLFFAQLAAMQPAIVFRQFGDGKEQPLCAAQGRCLWFRRSLHQMRGVTVLTRDAMPHMGRTPEFLLVITGVVATHAPVGILLRIAVKCKDQFRRRQRFCLITLSRCLRVRMSFARPVAGLTTGHYIRTRHLHRCMLRLRELRKFGRVTGAASVNSGVFLARLWPYRPHRN